MDGERGFSVFRLIFGLFLGLVVGLGCFLLSLTIIPLVGRNVFLIPMLNAAMLVGAAFLAFRHDTRDSLARGMLISLSLIFIFNVICGVSMIRP
jgi:hypothetical protein